MLAIMRECLPDPTRFTYLTLSSKISAFASNAPAGRSKSSGAGWDYGANLTYVRELCEYWRTGYDWRAHEGHLNRLPGFLCEVDGVDLHFWHIRGNGPVAVPAAAHSRLARFDLRVLLHDRPAHQPRCPWGRGRRRV
ncbi:MAG: epoxide hydrolase N-terminal domain-containing protein [Dehalococcoidia bacterium]|nr:epoxide hydrolase N-terminal domain-containing protein [Dehalococcoidia bacterium]